MPSDARIAATIRSGHALPVPTVNVRALLEEVLRRRVPRLESFAAELGPLTSVTPGRAGQRLATLVAAAQRCVAIDESIENH